MNNFPVGEFHVFPTIDDHLLTWGVTMEIPRLGECRIVQNLLYSRLWVHMHLTWTGLILNGQNDQKFVSFCKF